jgi:type VI secretion system secreted protein VgrG
MATTYRLSCDDWSIPPKVLAFRGREAISELYELEVALVWQSQLPFDPLDAMGAVASLTIEPDDGSSHTWHGVLDDIEIVREDQAMYVRAALRPRLSRSALTEHSRVFTDVSVPDIVQAVLASDGLSGAAVSMGVRDTYAARDHVCQYRESNLAFVRRLLERDGIFWFFDHDGEEEVLTLRDASSSLVPSRGAVRFEPQMVEEATIGDAFFIHRARQRSLPRGVRLHDYDPMRPRLAVDGASSVEGGRTGQVVRWGEHVLSPEEATRYARVRSEELSAHRDVFEARGAVIGLRPGYQFELTGHPHSALNAGYLVTGLVHRCKVVDVAPDVLVSMGFEDLIAHKAAYMVDVQSVRSTVAYRPRQVTPWPRIAGVVTAEVDGAGTSDYAQIDAEGRYRVKLHFDEGDSADGSRTTWVRMLQPHGGQPEGLHFPLRKKTEVAVVFLGGDPDRPFILGVAPNPLKDSPVKRGNSSQNVIQTGGANRLEMEDVAGGQYITLSTPTAISRMHLGAGPKNFALHTMGRGRFYTGSNYDIDVDVDLTEDVDGTVTETYNSNHRLSVTGPVFELMKTSLTQTVMGPVTNVWTGPLTETVDGHVSESYNATLSTTVTGGLTELTYTAGLKVFVAGAVTEKFTASQETTVNGPLVLIVGSNVDETFGSAERHVKGPYYLGVQGTYTLTTPNLVVNAPSYNVITASAQRMASDHLEIHGIKKSSNGTLFEYGKSKTSLTGAYLKATGLNLLLSKTTTVGAGGAMLLTTAAKGEPGIDKKFSGGFLLIMGGLKLNT